MIAAIKFALEKRHLRERLYKLDSFSPAKIVCIISSLPVSRHTNISPN